MQIAQHRLIHSQQEQSTMNYSSESKPTTPVSNQPLNFSINDRLSEQHLTQLDLCSKNLKKIDKLPNNISFNVVLLDHNDITKVEHLDILTHLVYLSISHNRLIDIRLISRLKTLQKLNLSNNSLDSIDCLKSLSNLVLLNISSNNIHNIGALNACHTLQSIDASDNSIRHIEDLSHLTTLKYLNLHKNLIDSLIPTAKYWPKSIHTLIVSDNEIKDLTEMCYLSSLIDLNTLFIHDNPCLFIVDDRRGCHQPFDYRPYIINWCLTVHNLDGFFVTRKESLKSEWLLSQGKGRSFRPGEHYDLVQYLIKVCGTDADERDELHLSRIMSQQDFYKQNMDEGFTKTSDTMKDANETLSKDSQPKLQQSLLVSESEFVKITPSSSVSTVNEQISSDHQMQTPSPRYTRSASHNDEPLTEHSSSNRYSDYDNRPIKPLDKNMLQSKLNQYPIENPPDDDVNLSRLRSHTNPQQSKRTSTQVAYNANRYSPKTTNRGPTTSTMMDVNMRAKPTKTSSAREQENKKTKRHTIAAENASTFHLMNRMTSTHTEKHKQQTTSNENKHLSDEDDDDGLQLKSAPINGMLSTKNTTYNCENSNELKKIASSVETMRTSVLQAYLDLHERFTKTTELQTSALAALWKMFETQNVTHQHEREKILQENRQLSQRLHELESHLNIKPLALYPPLRAHISKRDTKSFFLHWVPNPLNEQRRILGYRIYIDDILKGCVDAEKFETVIDCIRDEGEYRIKLRTYDENSESDDSNIVVARFRRQNPITVPQSDFNSSPSKPIHRTQSDHTVDTTSQQQTIKKPLRQTQSHDFVESTPAYTDDNQQKSPEQHNSSIKSSPSHSNDNNTSRKPPRSPVSSPNHSEPIIANGSCTKVLFSSDSNDTTKRSPTRIGIMSRLTKSPHRLNRNNVLINALAINQPENQKSFDNQIQSEVEPQNYNNHELFLFHQPEITTHLSSPIQGASISSRNQNILMNSYDQHSC